MSPSCLVLAAGTANPSLARAVARELDVPIASADIGRFPDGEVRIRLDEPITASLVADLLECAGVDHVVLVDVHAPQLEGFFRIPVDHLSAVPALCDEIGPLLPAKTVVVSPDAGRVQMATEYARRLRKPLVLLHKRRESESETEVTHIVGDVRDQACLLIDDMISSGGTIVESARALQEAGAGGKLFVAATHGLLIGDACERMAESGVGHLFVTDSLASSGERCAVEGLRLHLVSIAGPIAAAIRLQLVERSDARPRRIA